MILLSFINMKLRNDYASLSDLCLGLNLNQEELRQKLGAFGFEYQPAIRQFR